MFWLTCTLKRKSRKMLSLKIFLSGDLLSPFPPPPIASLGPEEITPGVLRTSISFTVGGKTLPWGAFLNIKQECFVSLWLCWKPEFTFLFLFSCIFLHFLFPSFSSLAIELGGSVMARRKVTASLTQRHWSTSQSWSPAYPCSPD